MRTGKLEKSDPDRPTIITKGSRTTLLELQGSGRAWGLGPASGRSTPEKREGISEQEQTSIRGIASQLV